MRDASLDEFLTDPDEGAEEPGDEAGQSHVEADAEPEPEPDLEPEPETEPSGGTGTGETEAGEGSGREPRHGSRSQGPPPVEEVEPARSTFAWSPDGAACDECGERAEERWAETELVCAECKEW